MAEQTDMELMQEYADSRSDSAFARLTQRHLNLVYSVALRYVGNAHDAQDVTQAVFVVLARKIPALRQRATLTGWLYETTRLTSRQLLRTRARQRMRDQEGFMQATLDQSATDDAWHQLAPNLETAMSRLAERDRELLALRFYENKTGAQAAALLGIGEEAAHKRTARALEKLWKFFNRRGVTLTAALIAAALSANAATAAPTGLVAHIAAAAKGATLGASTASLVQATLKTLFWAKCKTALGFAAASAVVLGTAVVAVSAKNNSAGRASIPTLAVAPSSPGPTDSSALEVIKEPLTGKMKFELESPPGAVALQADGKIVVGSTLFGRFVDETSGSIGFYTRGAFRLNSDGSLDRSFFCDVQVPASAAQMAHVDYLPDGRLFLSGLFGMVDGKPRPNYAMLLPDGSLDESFTPWRGASNQPAAFFLPNVAHPTSWALTSYQGGAMPATWLPDNSIAILCRSITSTNPSYSPLTSYRLDASGKWVLAAKISQPIVAPLDTLGSTGFWPRQPVDWTRQTIDTNLPFSQRYASLPAGEAAKILSALFAEMPIELCRYAVKLPDGGAILAVAAPGIADHNRVGPGKLVRFDKDWKPDFTFTNQYDGRGCLNIKRQKDGKILVAGMQGTLNGEDFPGLVRLNKDGSIDRSFHCETANSMDGRVMDMAIQDDGRIVICGFFSSVNGTEVPHLARINPDGSLDATFQTSFLTADRFYKELRERRRVAVARLRKSEEPAPAASTANTTGGIPASVPETILITLMKIEDNGARIEFTGIASRQYVLQANDSLHLSDWKTIATNQAGADGSGIFLDNDSSNHPTRFYRIATP